MAINLDIQAQLNALLTDQNKLLEAATKATKDQLTLTREMVAAMRGASFKDVAQDVQDTQQAIQGAAESTKAYGSTNADVFSQVQQALREAVKSEESVGMGLDAMGKKAKKFAASALAIDGFVQGLRMTHNMMTSIVSLGSGLVGSLVDIGTAIVSIPFKMLSGLIHMSDQGGGSNELQQALEGIRKEFGALHQTSGLAIRDMAKGMKGELANTGLSVYRIFGNLADRLKAMQEYAHNLGPLFSVLAGQFVKNSEAIGAYYKGLGLTEEAQKAVATRSYALGTAITEELRQIANYSLQLSKAFNGAAGSAKEISRDMGTLMADFKHFGGMATKEIGQAVVYFRRLGVEVSKVLGVIEKYDNFEDAAKGAAHLSQAFGLNVDALEMMKAQNPAQRVDMLRKSFFAAGRSVESMTRQERALLAQQTGLDDSALDLVFSMKNQGMSYDQVTKKADAAKKSQLTQAQVMVKLADAIERMVQSGSHGSGGFLDRFIQGFTVGIQRSMEFRKIMQNLRIDLRTAYFEGIKVGRAFVDMFPGVKEVFKGISDMFNPARFRTMFRRVTETFKTFFKALTTDPETALPKLLKNLQKDFFSWLQPNSANGMRILDGFKKFFLAMSTIAGSMIRLAADKLTKGIRFITDLISGRTSLSAPGSELGFIGELIEPIRRNIMAVAPDLWIALKSMFGAVWDRAQPWLRDNWLKIAGVLFAPALIGMIGRTLTGALISMFMGAIGRSLSSVASRGPGLVSRAFQGLTGAATKTAGALSGAAGNSSAGSVATRAIGGAQEASQAADRARITPGSIAKMALITLLIGTGMYFLITKGIVPLAKSIQDNHITADSIKSASITMIAAAAAMAAMGGAMALLNIATRGITAGSIGRMVVGVGMIGLIAAGMAWEGKQIINSLKDLKANDLAKAGIAMAAIGGFFVAAAAVTGLAGLVGMGAMAGGGLGALAIGAGLLAISATIEIMTVQGMRIMRTLNDFHASPGFEEKTRAFTTIMTAVGSFAGNIARLMEAVRPSFATFLFGNPAEEMRANMASVNVVVATMMASIGGLVTTIQRSVSALSGSPEQLKAGEMLASILSAVGSLASALSPPMEQLQAPGFFERVMGATGNTANNITVFGHNFSQMAGALGSILTQVQTAMHMLSGRAFTDSDRATIGLLPSLLTSVADMAKALMPNPAVAARLSESRNVARVADSISQVIQGVLHAITDSHIISNVARLITTFMQSIESADFSPSTLSVLQTALPAMTGIFGAVGQIATTLGTLVTATTGAHANPNALSQATIFVETLMNSLSSRLPSIMDSMVTTFGSLTPVAARGIAAGAAAFGTVMTAVTTLISGEMPTGADITAKFATLNMALFATQVGIESIAARFGNSTLAESVTNMVESIRRSHLSTAGTGIRALVTEVNAISSALHGLEPININTELQRIGDSLGLGRDGHVTIENRNFTINVNFVVKFDNNGLDAFELALLRRVGPGTGTRLQHTNVNP